MKLDKTFFYNHESDFAHLAKLNRQYLHYEVYGLHAFVYVLPRNLWAFVLYSDFENIDFILDDLRSKNFQVVYAFDKFESFNEGVENEISIVTNKFGFTFYAHL